LNANRFFQWRIGFAHIAFYGQTRIRFLEQIPGWAGNPAKTALFVYLFVNCVCMPACAFCRSVIASPDRHVDIVDFIHDHPDPGPSRIDAAVFWVGVKC
jgi:hypothetical protein